MSNNCYISLAGGVGNQLFQIAAAYAYSVEHNKKLILDFSEWSGSQGNHPSIYKNTLYRKFEFGVHPEETKEYVEPCFNYSKIPVFTGDVNLRGYFQSFKYFKHVVSEFLSLIEVPKINCSSKRLENVVAWHVRRGDYLIHKDIHHVCTADYFLGAMKTFFPTYKVHIYTDAPRFVVDEFKDIGFEYNIIKTKNEIQDLYMLGVYDNIICSNSSFSWWGSLLGCKKSKIVVPNIWFKNFQDHNDIYRPDFIKYEI